MRENPTLLSARQVSDYLSISIRTVQRLSVQGKLKSVKIGSRWKFFKSDIETYFYSGNEPQTQPIATVREKRAYPRINSNFNCSYSINLTPFKEIIGAGFIKNLSAGGVLAVCQGDGIVIGDPIKMDFMDTAVEGRVVRKDKNELGVKFRNIKEETKEKITAYVG